MIEKKTNRVLSILFLLKVIPIFYFILFIVAPFLYPEYFPWISNIKLYLVATIAMLIYQTIIFILAEVFRKQSLWMHIGYVFAVFYGLFIYLTGGLDSTFMFAMVFIPIISATYLNERLSINTGLFTILVMVSTILFDKNRLDPVYVIKYLMHIAVYSLMVFYLYKIVKEVMMQRFEKERLKRQFVELSELDNVKQIFLTATSHQLKSPLAGARWALDTAIQNKDCADIKILTEGRERVVQAINIIEEMIKTAEYDLGDKKIILNKEKITLNSIVEKIISNLAYLIQGSAISLILNIKEGVAVYGDKKVLDLALANIFDNAFRYAPKSKVTVTIKKEGQYAKLTVEDNGIGIDSADQEYVFQKFFRGKNALRLDPNQSGVGLYATKKIVEMHGGSIKISSILGKGTKVEVFLPLD
ncbi:MAG: HAMP domain-containing sensor histidine kinase [Candidatus Paceibacterota bacterium]|jgi:signal transduction histidine kinase